MPSSSNDLIPKHVRAARALLAWSQQDLAKHAGLATSTVADFERGQRTPIADNAQAMRSALEAAGIRFLPTGAVIGPAIPLVAVSKHPGAPVRWVDAEDLANWANRNDGAVDLPTLVANLVRATHGPAVQLRFPSDGGSGSQVGTAIHRRNRPAPTCRKASPAGRSEANVAASRRRRPRTTRSERQSRRPSTAQFCIRLCHASPLAAEE